MPPAARFLPLLLLPGLAGAQVPAGGEFRVNASTTGGPRELALLPLDRGAGAPGRGERMRGGNYCPAAAVSREQMGVFLGVTFALGLYP